MPANLLLFISVATVNISLAAFVLLRNPKSWVNKSFFIFVGVLSFWSISVGMLLTQKTMVWSDLALFSGVLIGASFILFAKYFPEGTAVSKKFAFFFFILPAVIFIILAPFRPFVSGIIVNGDQIQPVIGPLYPPLMLWLVFSPLFGIFLLFRKFKHSVGQNKSQLFYLFWGFFLFLGGVTVTNVILPALGIGNLAFFGPVFTMFMAGFTSVAIVKHRLLDIRLIVARVVAYTLLVIVLGAIYAIGILAVGAFVTGGVQPALEFIASTVVLALIIAFTFQPIRRFLEKITDTIFYKHRYSTSKLLYDLALIMASTLRLEHLTHKLLKELLSQMHVSRGALVLLAEDGGIYEVAHEGYTFTPEFDEKDIKELVDYHDMLIIEELPEGNYKNILRKLDATCVVYLSTEGRYMGLLALGEKLSGDIYTSEDLRLLKIFAPEAAVAIQNAQSYEEIHRFSLTLQEEVNRATKELLIANKKLESLDKLKDEFLSLASHELRTPMTAIKSYLWMVLEGRVGKISEKQKDYLDIAYKSTDRLIALVNDMLNISRIESGKLTPDLKAVKLNQLVDDVVVEMTLRATELGVGISVVSPTLPEVWADLNKIKEVLINLIGNSLKFTPRGGKITIKLQKKDNFVETSVSDTGTGIKTEDLPKLFQKFSMLGSSLHREKNTKGTGLGLYLSKLIVELHGGRIWAQSQGIGKGATFTFSLKVFEKQ